MMNDFSTSHVTTAADISNSGAPIIIIRSLLHSSDTAVMLLQEHWLSADQLLLLGNVDANYLSCILAYPRLR